MVHCNHINPAPLSFEISNLQGINKEITSYFLPRLAFGTMRCKSCPL
ncbi:uncharacterized protein J3R85_007051 [Psidium guajava]|nr:uncharacterized protein J3R85_007051 [Psidium guajava]